MLFILYRVICTWYYLYVSVIGFPPQLASSGFQIDLFADCLEIILQYKLSRSEGYGCVTWSPCACHYDTLRRAHHRFLTHCIGWRKHNRSDHPISYLDTLIKTASERIEATLRRRRILFAGTVARMEDTTLTKYVMFE